MKRSIIAVLLTLTLFSLTSAAQAGSNDKEKNSSPSTSNKKRNLGNILPALDKPNNKPFQALPYGKPGKPKPIGQTKPFHQDQQGNGGGAGNGSGPGTGQGNGQGNGQQHPKPNATTRPEDLFPGGKPPKPTKPGFTWVEGKPGMPGHWERERAPQAKPVITGVKNPQHVWIAEKNGVPGHWERQRADGKYQIYWDKDGSSYWVPQY
jgi:hypothetical protein